MIRAVALALSLFVVAEATQAGPSVYNKGSSTIVLEDVITGGTLAPLTNFLIKQLAGGKRNGSIDMVINSPGGSVVAGFEFVSLMNALQAKGWTFRCYVYHVAASMAFQILNQCNERHTLNPAFLLWHRARVSLGMGGAGTSPMFRRAAEQLKTIDDAIMSDLTLKMGGADQEWISEHFEAETLHVGQSLHSVLPNYITTHSAISGIVEALQDKKLVRSATGFSIFGMFREGEIIYIWNKAVDSPGVH